MTEYNSTVILNLFGQWLITFSRGMKSIMLPFILVGIFFMYQSCLYSQDINMRVQHITAEDGLSENHVECIYKDSRGFIWIGTRDGLNRFDGHELKVYRPDETDGSISSSIIFDITEDASGHLWLATRNGLNKFIFEEDRFESYTEDTTKKNSLSDNWLKTLMFDKNGNLWIGTANAGVDKIVFDSGNTNIRSVTNIPAQFGNNKCLTHFNVYSLMEDHEGNIWIGSFMGLDKLDPETGTVEKFTDPENSLYFDPTVVHSLYECNDHIVWVGTENGLIKLDYEQKNQSIYRENTNDNRSLIHPIVNDICENSSGQLLIGTLRGLQQYHKDTDDFTMVLEEGNDEHSLNSQFINEIYCDNYGIVWLGTDNGGVNKYNNNQKAFYYLPGHENHPVDINETIINSIWESEDYLWIGSAGKGLLAYDPDNGSIRQFERDLDDPTTISTNYISALTSNKQGEVWAATWGRGLNKVTVQNDEFRIRRYHRVDESKGLPFVYISGILFDGEDRLWIGRSDGLEILDTKTDRLYMLDPPDLKNHISDVASLYIDENRYVWMGTINGLYRFKLSYDTSREQVIYPDTVFYYSHDPDNERSLGGSHVVDIHKDKTGQMWFSIYGNGLSKLEYLSPDGKTAEFSHYTTEQGLSNNVVYGILEDDHHNLWMSTDRGLTKYNYKDSTSHHYFETDGLQSNQFYWSAFHKNQEGYMYFGGIQGLNYFHPDSIGNVTFSPPVVITDFQLFNESVPIDPEGKDKLSRAIPVASDIYLKYEENIISFEFAALGYDQPDKIKYKYKMEGFDDTWTYTNADRRYVTYTNLNPGEYTFRVNATNKDGVWNEKGTFVRVHISPPWWQTIWFIVAASLFIIGLLYWIYKLRVYALHKQKLQLEQTVSKRTEELKSANTELKALNATKDKFFAIIAHDLKSPFNALLGMSELLHARYDNYEDDKRRNLAGMIYQSADQIYKLLENLLQWSRSQTGDISFVPENFRLSELVETNIYLMDNLISEKNITLYNEVDPEIYVYADKNLSNTIIRNLVSNAVKFTENGEIHIDAQQDGHAVTVHIRDNGTGINKDEVDNLFHIDRTNLAKGTRGESGTGLGLILCREFVEKNGGKIWAQSKVGEGSVFSFTLPVQRNPENGYGKDIAVSTS